MFNQPLSPAPVLLDNEANIEVSPLELAAQELPDASVSDEISDTASKTQASPYRVDDGGLWLVDLTPNTEHRKPDQKICNRLEVIALARDTDSDSWGLLVSFQDDDGHEHMEIIPRADLLGNGLHCLEPLADKGLRIVSPRELLTYFRNVEVPNRVRLVSRIGWHGDAYVLPDATFGPTDEPHIMKHANALTHAFQISGTLEEWQEHVGKKCVGNSRLAFAASAAFAAPLLDLIGEDSGGFHFRGGSSTGKTTALLVAGSVWGGGKSGYLQRWRATANGLEGVALNHCDALLLLDELGQIAPDEAGSSAYTLANGSAKVRADKHGNARKKATWRTLFLSSGEISLADHMGSVGKKARGGQEVRMADIPANAGKGLGIFEELHDADSADAFARELADASKRFYGVAIRAYLEKLSEHRSEIADAVAKHRKDFHELGLVPEGASGEVTRVAGRFSLVSAAGEIAAAWGLLPWQEGEALLAAATCFEAWLVERGGPAPIEESAAIAQVRKFIQQYGDERFAYMSTTADGRHITSAARNRAGYSRTVNGETEYLFLSDVFRSEICSGYDHTMVARALEQRGYLKRGQADRLTTKVQIPGQSKRAELYLVTSAILEAE